MNHSPPDFDTDEDLDDPEPLSRGAIIIAVIIAAAVIVGLPAGLWWAVRGIWRWAGGG